MYEVYLIKPDKSEELLHTVDDPTLVKYIVETQEYAGTWMSDTKKLLRKNKGQIVIRQIKEPRIVSSQPLVIGTRTYYELTVKYHHELSTIRISEYILSGYNHKQENLWFAESFNKLADIVGKEIAFQALQYYEMYLNEYELKGVM